MLSETLGMLGSMFNQLFGILTRFYNKYDVWTLLIGAFIVFTVCRMLLVPIVGGNLHAGTSDVVKDVRSKGTTLERQGKVGKGVK